MADARRFLYNSDYPTPTFVWSYEGTFQNPSGVYDKDFVVPHGLPFTPLIVGYYTADTYPDTIWTLGMVDRDSDLYPIVVSADSSNIHIHIGDVGDVKSKVTLHLAGLLPADYEGDVSPFEDTTNFRFNSDFRYPKLYMAGFTPIPVSDDGTTETVTVRHGLGYVPKVRVWLNRNGKLGMTTLGSYIRYGYFPRNQGFSVDEQNVYFYRNPKERILVDLDEATSAYYQIYLD